MQVVFGLTGTLASGKGTVKNCFDVAGIKYTYASLSDAIRKEASKLKLDQSRETLIKLGNKYRQKYGLGIWAKKTIEMLKNVKGFIIIDGIRNLGEVSVLRQHYKEFYLIGIDASIQTRFRRIKNRARSGDPKTFEEFIKLDYSDRGFNVKETSHQQVENCMEEADYLIWNEKTFTDIEKSHLFAKIVDAYNLFVLKKKRRPTFEETFMDIAYNWASRSTCLRRKVGAVIAKDNRQLTSGYNGAPRKFLSCLEKNSCLRRELNIPSGERQEICWAVHAEQNAIIQAARDGISIEGATLYITHHPCFTCAKMIVNAGIKKIIYGKFYPDSFGEECLKLANEIHGLEIRRYEGVTWKKLKFIFARE